MAARAHRLLPAAVALGFLFWAMIALGRPRTRLLPPREPVPAAAKVTFNRDVAPLLQSHCQTCHHEGGIAPFPLVTYRTRSQKKP